MFSRCKKELKTTLYAYNAYYVKKPKMLIIDDEEEKESKTVQKNNVPKPSKEEKLDVSKSNDNASHSMNKKRSHHSIFDGLKFYIHSSVNDADTLKCFIYAYVLDIYIWIMNIHVIF